MGEDLGYLFGCCAACRAPLEPSRASNMSFPENQSVFYVMSRFEELSAKGAVKSQFTGEREMSHLVTRAKYGVAIDFASKIPVDKLDEGLPGYDPEPSKCTYRSDRVFTTQLSAARRRGKAGGGMRGAGGEVDPEIVKEIEESLPAGMLNPKAQAKEIAEKITRRVDSEYQAVWGPPETAVKHAKLQEWMQRDLFVAAAVDLDKTTACCSLCNDIWDCFARTRRSMQEKLGTDLAVVPALSVQTAQSKAKHTLPVENEDGVVLAKLGCLVAYYLHACLRDLKQGGVADDRLDLSRRPLTLLLLWLPFHANAMHREMTAGRGVKGYHNYVGCLDLLLSYYAYACACADPAENFSDFPFERFHVFYLKELSECPPPIWPDPAAHPRLHDFVFDAGHRACAGVFSSEVSHVSDRLQELYRDVVKPVLPLLRGSAAVPVADEYFLTRDEADELVRDRLRLAAGDLDNLRLHMHNAGVAAILYQVRKALREEPEHFGREVDRWIRARMYVEWGNMAGNSGRALGVESARDRYLECHTALNLPAAAGAVDARRPHCSVWKAALRLRPYLFTTRPDVREAYEDDYGSDEEVAGLGGRFSRMLVGGPSMLKLAFSNASPPSRAARAAARSPAGSARQTQRPSAAGAAAAWRTGA